jgi:hypothetical protein
MAELVIDIRECDEDAAIAAVDRAYQRRSELRSKLAANIPAVRASVLELFNRLSIDPIRREVHGHISSKTITGQ